MRVFIVLNNVWYILSHLSHTSKRFRRRFLRRLGHTSNSLRNNFVDVFKRGYGVYMGNQPTVFYLYGRLKLTDRWEGQPLHAFKESSMGKFKHAVYSLALKRRFHDYHKLYLYQGRTRVVKCEMKKNEEGYRALELEFSTREAYAEWLASSESIFGSSASLLQPEFDEVYRGMDGNPLEWRYMSSRPIG